MYFTCGACLECKDRLLVGKAVLIHGPETDLVLCVGPQVDKLIVAFIAAAVSAIQRSPAPVAARGVEGCSHVAGVAGALLVIPGNIQIYEPETRKPPLS